MKKLNVLLCSLLLACSCQAGANNCFAATDAEYDALNIQLLRTQLELIKTQEAVTQKQRELDSADVIKNEAVAEATADLSAQLEEAQAQLKPAMGKAIISNEVSF